MRAKSVASPDDASPGRRDATEDTSQKINEDGFHCISFIQSYIGLVHEAS